MKKRFMALVLGLFTSVAGAAEVNVAVAANFTAPMKEIAAAFAAASGHEAVLSFGATGAFYAQIKNGAPFAVLLAADSKTAVKLEDESLAVAGTSFVYARGRLALWSATPGLVDDAGKVLAGGGFQRLALANPKLAPYGVAAVQTMDKMGLSAALQPLLVQGESIAQTYQFVASGNAELGFVAYSQLRGAAGVPGSFWLVPEELHAPIDQAAVLLKAGEDNAAARELLQFLRSAAARKIIEAYGYSFPG